MRKHDSIIRGGHVVDPANRLDAVLDIGMRYGRISAIEHSIDPELADATYDASGKIVTPGLVDLHIHGYHLVSPLSVPVEICAREGFWPDTISTDIHSGTCEGPAYDMPTVMTRLLHVGMPLNEVVARSTFEPAKAIGWEDRIGTLGIGREADIAVFSVEAVDMALEDCQSQLRKISRLLVPQAVWRAGVAHAITQPKRFPNPETIQAQRVWWKQLQIRDESQSAGL